METDVVPEALFEHHKYSAFCSDVENIHILPCCHASSYSSHPQQMSTLVKCIILVHDLTPETTTGKNWRIDWNLYSAMDTESTLETLVVMPANGWLLCVMKPNLVLVCVVVRYGTTQ